MLEPSFGNTLPSHFIDKDIVASSITLTLYEDVFDKIMENQYGCKLVQGMTVVGDSAKVSWQINFITTTKACNFDILLDFESINYQSIIFDQLLKRLQIKATAEVKNLENQNQKISIFLTFPNFVELEIFYIVECHFPLIALNMALIEFIKPFWPQCYHQILRNQMIKISDSKTFQSCYSPDNNSRSNSFVSNKHKTISAFNSSLSTSKSTFSNDSLIPSDLSNFETEIGPNFPDLQWVEQIYKVYIIGAKTTENLSSFSLEISQKDLEFILNEYMHFISSKQYASLINQMIQKFHKTSPKIKSGKSYSDNGTSENFWSLMELNGEMVVHIKVRSKGGEIINKQTLKAINSLVSLSVLAPIVYQWISNNK